MDADSTSALPEPITAALAQLAEIVRDQEALRYRLLGLQASLPPTPAEEVRLLELDEDGLDTVTQIRGVIQCVLEDFIGPALRDLRRLAAGSHEGGTT